MTAPVPKPLYRTRWLTLMRANAVNAIELTGSLRNDLWAVTRDQFLFKPEVDRPLLPDGSRRIEPRDLITDDGQDFIRAITYDEIRRSDDRFLPDLVIAARKERKGWYKAINLTYLHPDRGRMKLGMFTPKDAIAYVVPTFKDQRVALTVEERKVRAICRACRDKAKTIADQLKD